MEIVVSIPDDFVPPAGPASDISREILEAYAIEKYRQEELSLGAVAEILELSIDEAHTLLKTHKVPLNYDIEDVARDLQTIDLLLQQ